MVNYLSTAGVILLESYQLTEAVQLGCKPSEISDLASLSLNLHYWVYDYFTFKYILLYSNCYYNY